MKTVFQLCFYLHTFLVCFSLFHWNVTNSVCLNKINHKWAGSIFHRFYIYGLLLPILVRINLYEAYKKPGKTQLQNSKVKIMRRQKFLLRRQKKNKVSNFCFVYYSKTYWFSSFSSEAKLLEKIFRKLSIVKYFVFKSFDITVEQFFRCSLFVGGEYPKEQLV